ncbi:uncharacterized protein LAESUDRAFT_808196 [Laetiporus sulphureus 93-53]|uniref:Uncharacterized protein n=1 Tax=Laetiporus sulphureus 93-53 TaxID=1314785 RepID=A0A165I5D9_9APHY|nr:uncharacterized protein LAESUDRAFT_808196 [Laetiporus sulphureus 93-53]KZT12611.1 hypothetical protein LAESUDRAFT_808196 [Laetiporus sulphureus 93-53]
MDHSAATDAASEEAILADKIRLDSFRLGRAPPSSNMSNGPNPRHARSHSRNGSVSVPLAFPTPSATAIDESSAHTPRSSISKRNSHHRRRSSVSTRRESADMMGVALPSLTPSTSEDNISLGDKDSIRRRALWALEGKTDVGTFSKVEIPEFDTAETAKRSFEFPTKPSFPPGIGSKRDSLGKFMSSSSTKEQLHTLVEEEEEEEEVVASPDGSASSQVTVASPAPTAAPFRHRPASLNLRPLSLPQMTDDGLPTPGRTPSPNAGIRSGLRSLTLPARRHSLIATQSPSPMSGTFARRPSLNMPAPGQSQSFPQPGRRSSIAYVCSAGTPPQSVTGLPTPEMTPTSTGTSVSEDLEAFIASRPSRPLSTSEQHFLFQAHTTLVRRITDLERALSSRASRPWSRPESCASESSVVSGVSEPSDEMLQLIADLKAERDELKKDADGWRVRVADLERQAGRYAQLVEAERQAVWAVQERAGLLEVEKRTLEEALDARATELKEAKQQLNQAKADAKGTKQECERLRGEVERLQDVEAEVIKFRDAFESEKKRREEIEKDLEHAGLLATPRAFETTTSQFSASISRSLMYTKRGLGFQSIDSESSFTDVDSLDSPHDKQEFGLNAVQEEDEETLSNFSEEDELARFEDEEEGDAEAFPMSLSTSSFDSGEDETHTSPKINVVEVSPPLIRQATQEPSPVPTPVAQSHARHASLQKAWTFPAGCAPSPWAGGPEEIDRFFGCLEDVDNSPPMDSRLHSFESSKRLFAQALAEADDELPPFVLPSHVGVEVSSPEIEEQRHTLDVVIEVEEEEDMPKSPEDEFVGEVDEGGIKFTFMIPPEYQESLVEESQSDTTSATFETDSSITVVASVGEGEDKTLMLPQTHQDQIAALPSSIPRPTPIRASSIPVPIGASSPHRSPSAFASRNCNIPATFASPTTKRGGSPPTSIPQPRFKSSSPSSSKVASFIPQPKRTPSLASSRPSTFPLMSPPTKISTPSPKPPRTITSSLPSASPTMKCNVSLSSDHSSGSPPAESSAQSPVSPSSLMSLSPTLAARLSFQTLTNYISMPSLPWSPRSYKSSAAAAALCLSPERSSISSSSSNESLNHHKQTTFSESIGVRSVSARPKESPYVQREKQLEKLRLRIEDERRLQRRDVPNVNSGRALEGLPST